MKPRLIFATFDVIPSAKGACRHVAADLDALQRRFDVTLFSLADQPGLAVTRFSGARHIRIGLGEENYLDRALGFRQALRRFLEEERFAWGFSRSHWEGLALAGRVPRLVAEVNGLASLELPDHYPALARRPALRARLRAEEVEWLRAATAVIAVSQVTADCLAGLGVPAERLRIIPNGVDPELFFPLADKPGPFTMIYTGTLAPWQGVDFMLQNLRPLLRRRPGLRLRLVVAGPRDWFRSLRELVRALRLKKLVELHHDLDYASTAALVRSSHLGLSCLTRGRRNRLQGCSPLKLIEYQAAGLPVVAPDLPVVRELVADDRMLYRPGRAASFREAVTRWLDDPAAAAAAGRAASRRAHEEFGWARHGERLLGIFKR